MVIKQGNKLIIPFRAVIKWLVRLRRSPKAIAGGFAAGTFVALTPTFGIQFGIALVLATAINVNRPAALLTVWITNIATIAPIYTFNYWVGKLIWGGPAVKDVYALFMDLAQKFVTLKMWDMLDQFKILMGLSKEIIIPLLIGSTLVGLVASGLVYLLSMTVIRFLLKKREQQSVLLT